MRTITKNSTLICYLPVRSRAIKSLVSNKHGWLLTWVFFMVGLTRNTFSAQLSPVHATKSTVSATVDLVAGLLPVSATVDFQLSRPCWIQLCRQCVPGFRVRIRSPCDLGMTVGLKKLESLGYTWRWNVHNPTVNSFDALPACTGRHALQHRVSMSWMALPLVPTRGPCLAAALTKKHSNV